MLLQQIESFLAVADAANFTRASKAVNISQPTLSRHISTLEDELGFELFRRDRRPLRLTESGRVFYDGMKKALAQMSYTCDMATAAAEGKSGLLRVGFVSDVYIEYRYLPLLDELKGAVSQLHVECSKLPAADLLRGLEDESVDLAFCFDFAEFRRQGFLMTPLSRLPIGLAMSARSPLAEKETLGREDIEGETLFLSAPMEPDIIRDWMHMAYGTDQLDIVQTDSNEVSYLRILSEGGIAITNGYDPIMRGNPLYHCVGLPDESLFPEIFAITNPRNDNPAKDLFLELLKHAPAPVQQDENVFSDRR